MTEVNDYGEMDLAELAAEMKRTEVELADAKAVATDLQKKWDLLRKNIIPEKMESMGLETTRITGIGTIGFRHDAYCNVIKGAAPDLMEWLRDNGAGDLIKENVNSSSLKAYIKELFNNGEEIPEAYVNFNPYTYVSITK